MKKVLFSLFLILIVNCSENDYRFPAEWEKHDSIWLAWASYENIQGRSSTDVQVDIIQALAPFVKINLLVQTEEQIQEIKNRFKNKKISIDPVSFHVIPHEDLWMRDMGAIFLKSKKNKSLKVADFSFNQWGYSKELTADDKIDSIIAKKMNLSIIKTNLIAEGGGWETNGQGVLMTTWSVMSQRNPNLSKEQIESELKKTLNVKKFIWVKEGVPEDRQSTIGKMPDGSFTPITTGGHVDEFVRFVKEDTILLAEISEEEAKKSEILKEGRRILEETYEVVSKATDINGKAFKIIRIPTPDLLYETISDKDEVFKTLQGFTFDDGSKLVNGKKEKIILATSYMNFLVTNGVVLMQSYYKQGRSKSILEKDLETKKILQSIYPERKIIMINPENLNLGGGGIHCITQQQPSLE
jgi:agmatine deiminase